MSKNIYWGDGSTTEIISSESSLDSLKNSGLIVNNFKLNSIANAPAKLPITTPPEGKDSPIHPKVLFLPNKFGGHFFWMAYTPWPAANNNVENPCIACSDDMVNWNTPEGVTNPLDTGKSTTDYLSDTHLVYKEKTNTLEVWYRECNETDHIETIWRRTSTDGITWTEREAMFISSNGTSHANFLSPTLIYEDGMYKIWVCHSDQTAYYYTSQDGTNWELVSKTNLKAWHLDVIHTELGYEAICYDNTGDGKLTHSVSEDGITFSEAIPIIRSSESGWDSGKVYRSSVIKENGIYYLYYTSGTNGIGLSVTKEKNDVTSFGGYVSGSGYGVTLFDIADRLNSLESV